MQYTDAAFHSEHRHQERSESYQRAIQTFVGRREELSDE